MDTGKGYMEQFKTEKELRDRMGKLSEQRKKLFKNYTEETGIFRIGEEIEIKGSKFKVNKITPKKITLRILPQ